MTYDIETAAAALAACTVDDEQALVQQIAAETGWPIVEDCLVPAPDMWYADDGNAGVVEAHKSGRTAAQSYVDDGDWGEIVKTTWITVVVWRVGIDGRGDTVQVGRARHKITLDPEEPACIDGEEHDWQNPHDIVGGIESNPGVWGHGGGVKIAEVCMRCGCGRHTDTWAQDPEDGEQGLTSVLYEPGKYEATVARLMEQGEDAQ